MNWLQIFPEDLRASLYTAYGYTLMGEGMCHAVFSTTEKLGTTIESTNQIFQRAIPHFERAITIGLLPDIDRDRFYYLGNASLTGCRISLSDNKRFRDRTEDDLCSPSPTTELRGPDSP